MPVETEPWWPELLALKDTMSLRDLAARFGVGLGALSLALRATNTSRTPVTPSAIAATPPAAAPIAAITPVAPAPIAASAPTEDRGPAGIWRISLRDDDRPRACIARSFCEAFAHAAGIGDVIAVERLGDVLAA